jgi:hypothetical protein
LDILKEISHPEVITVMDRLNSGAAASLLNGQVPRAA